MELKMLSVAVGAQAPEFSLKNQNNKTVALSDYRGSWLVLYFYPKDDTPGCTKQACGFTERKPHFDKLGAKVVGVSADHPEDHRMFFDKYDLEVELLSDPETTVLQTYQVWGEQEWQGKTYMGIRRETFLINPDGVVVYHWPNVRPATHAQEVRAKVAQLS